MTITKGKATITIPSVAAGKAALVNVTKIEETNVKKISVTVVNAVKNIQIIVEKPADKPAEVTNPSETVYHYLKVDKTNFTDSDVSSATIDFQVEKAWLTANNIDESTVALNRYESSGWRKLTTTKLSSNTTHVSYSAQSPGLSVFAITGSQPSAATTTTTVPQAGAATTTTTTVPGQQPPGAAPSGGTDMLILGFVGLVVIAIVGAAYYYKRQPKGGFSYKAR
ncbi:MAG: PGF-pre-PGF domain-containing protein [Candidatus Aenigmarchaeota archaeon]|nr:PGF-pre-PGF domain-containing protein [Candidatus Aenigmarchaeota archaeon]